LPKPILGGVNDAELLEPPTVKIIAEDIPSETPLELN